MGTQEIGADPGFKIHMPMFVAAALHVRGYSEPDIPQQTRRRVER